MATPPRSVGARAGGPGVPRGLCGSGRRAPPPRVARTQAGVAGRLCHAVHATAHGKPRRGLRELEATCGLVSPWEAWDWGGRLGAGWGLRDDLQVPQPASLHSDVPLLEVCGSLCWAKATSSRARVVEADQGLSGWDARRGHRRSSSRESRCDLHAFPEWNTSLLKSV